MKALLTKMEEVGDGVMKHPKKLLVMGVSIGLISQYFDLWSWLEPAITFLTLAMSAIGVWQTKKAKSAYYATDNGDDVFVIALEVGRPISEAVKKSFGQLDALIRVQDVIGTSVLTMDEHYEKIARAVYTACAANQNRQIKLIVSGPNGLLAIIGMMLGMDRFRVQIYQYYNGIYTPIPRPTRDWLEHRDQD